jgi:hypothetical protein
MALTQLRKIEHGSPQALRELALIYGIPGSGKTRLATSLPERWGKIAYFAFDKGSEKLDSVLPQYRDRIDVFKPSWKDPILGAAEIELTDWKKLGYDTIELDTFTTLCRAWLRNVTDEGHFQEKRNYIGTPGKPGFVALSDKGHYGGTATIIQNFIDGLIDKQPEMNIICICHEYLREKDKDGGGSVLGGPATVGKASLEWLAAQFSTVIRMDRSQETTFKDNIRGEKTVLVARMAQHGNYIARRNESGSGGNPLPKLVLDPDPINFWRKYDETSPQKESK